MIEAYLIVGFVLWIFVIAQFDLIHLNKTDIILSAVFLPICVLGWLPFFTVALFREIFKCERI